MNTHAEDTPEVRNNSLSTGKYPALYLRIYNQKTVMSSFSLVQFSYNGVNGGRSILLNIKLNIVVFYTHDLFNTK